MVEADDIKWPKSFTPGLIVELSKLDKHVFKPKQLESNRKPKRIGRVMKSFEAVDQDYFSDWGSARSKYEFNMEIVNADPSDKILKEYKHFIDEYLEHAVSNLQEKVDNAFENVENKNNVVKEVLDGELQMDKYEGELEDYFLNYSDETRGFLEDVGVVNDSDDSGIYMDEVDLNYITFFLDERMRSKS